CALPILSLARRSRLAFVGGSLMIAGYVCYFGVLLSNVIIITMAEHGGPLADFAAVIDASQSDTAAGWVFPIFIVGNLLGTLLFAIGLLRSHTVPIWAAILIMLWPPLHVAGLFLGGEVLEVIGAVLQAMGFAGLACRRGASYASGGVRRVNCMEERVLGRTERPISVIGLGTWQLGADWGEVSETAALDVLSAAVESGVTFFDTADVYGDGRSERMIGRFRAENPDLPIMVATKMGRRVDQVPENYTLQNFRAWTDRSRRNLGVDRLDLVQLHCPPTAVYSRDQIYDALDTLV